MSVVDVRPDRLRFLAVLLAALGLQTLLVSFAMPLSELNSETPMLNADQSAHWYRMTAAVHLADGGFERGYDPYFGAGSLRVPSDEVASRIPAFFATRWPSVSVARVWKWYSLLAGFVAVLCAPLGLRMLGADWRRTALGALLGLILWWISMFRWFHTAGMVSFVLGAYVSFAYLCGVVRYVEGRGGWPSIAALGLVGALGLVCHPLFPLPIAAGTVFLLVAHRHEWSWRRVWPLLVIVPAVSLIPNVGWLAPGVAGRTGSSYPVPHQQLVDVHFIWREMLGIWSPNAAGARLNPALVLAAAWACIAPGPERRHARVFTSLWAAFVVLAALGSSWGALGRMIQPNRFAPVGYLFLIVSAVIGAGILARFARELPRSRRLAARVSLLLCVAVLLFCVNEVRREVTVSDRIGHYGGDPPQVKGAGPRTRFVLDWLARDTDTSARVLFETANGRVHDNCHIAGYCAQIADREFVGGPYPFSGFAGFWDGFLFDRPISDFAPAELRSYLELYNIGWVLVHSEEAKRVFDALPGVVAGEERTPLKAYRVAAPPGYFAQGSGRVVGRGHNRIVIDDLAGDEVVLRYHYLTGLRSDPPVEIVPVLLLDDPIPFVKLIRPPKRLRLFLD